MNTPPFLYGGFDSGPIFGGWGRDEGDEMVMGVSCNPRVPYLLLADPNLNLCFDVAARFSNVLPLSFCSGITARLVRAPYAAKLEKYRGMRVCLNCHFLSSFLSPGPSYPTLMCVAKLEKYRRSESG
jgi:hypothetical protein